jgi:hypothetical protein
MPFKAYHLLLLDATHQFLRGEIEKSDLFSHP